MVNDDLFDLGVDFLRRVASYLSCNVKRITTVTYTVIRTVNDRCTDRY